MTDLASARPCRPFGVEMTLDLREELSPPEQAELKRLYDTHDLLVVHGPILTMDDQIRVMGHLGPVLRTVDSIGEISRDSPIGLGGARLCFHSDYAYSPEPLPGISLHAIDVEDEATSTRFAAGRTGWAALDPARQAALAELFALQVFGVDLDRRNRFSEVGHLPSTAHPLVWEHPGTGGRFLFAPEMTTDSIVGVAADRSEALIAEVFGALYGEANVLEHRWSLGDLVIWNNVSVVHARGDCTGIERRTLQRVGIGTKGYYELYPEMAEEMATHGWSDADGPPVG